MSKLMLASITTIGIIGSFIFGIVSAAMVYGNFYDLPVALMLTLIINILLWLVGPTLSDLINRWFYKVEFLTPDVCGQRYPELTAFIQSICTEYRFSFPKIGIIPDRNPTAFTYGTVRSNARIVLTKGMFEFLSPGELKAVVAHELGHIVHGDFTVMMIASTMVQMLYQIYAALAKSRKSGSSRKKGNAAIIGLAAYILYLISIYLLYYLSRTREYMADEFAAYKANPVDLSTALVKIAYGIVTVDDTDSSKELLESTRHLGIIDVKNAKHLGAVSYITNHDPQAVSEVMVFDKVSPWAKIIELSSTHPLTGKRIDALSSIAHAQSKPFPYDVSAAIERMHVDSARLSSGFAVGVLVLLTPYIFAGICFLISPLLTLAAFGLGLLLTLPYRFPQAAPRETTVLDIMRDPYASPVHGSPITLKGQVIGRGVPGYIFSEDMMYQDKTGMIFLDFQGMLGFISNIFFAYSKLEKLYGVPSQAAGWFTRGMGSMVTLKYIQTGDARIVSHPLVWKVIQYCLLIAIGVGIYVAVLASPDGRLTLG